MVDAIKGLISSPLDGATQEEIKELIKSVLVTFTTQYVKAYTIELVKKLLADASAEPGPEWKLMERPPREDAYMEGWVEKEGGFFTRKFQKRYFVVRPDYMINNFETESEAKKPNGKVRGVISLCGYYVNDDANNGILQRLTKLAEKMGMDLSGLPKPKEYPPNTMELHHSRRQTYMIKVDDAAEFKKWVEQMRTCAWRARGWKNKDEVHIKAFERAIRETRWKLGRWGWWSYGGTEEQILSDLISDELDWAIMGRVYSKITGSWTVRNAMRNQVIKIIDKLVIAAVSPAWAGMDKTVTELRPKIEPKINELVAPVGEAKLAMMTKIKDACMSVVTPILEEHVIPHLAKIVEVIQSPVNDAFKESYKLFDEEWIGKFEPKSTADENKKEFRHLDYYPWSWKFYDVTRQVDVMYEPLWALHIIFADIYPWSLIWTAHDVLRTKADNAIYTYEQLLLKEQAENEGADIKAISSKVKDQVLEQFKEDGTLARILYYKDILMAIVMPPFNKLVFPAAEALLEPLNSAIPDPVKEFLDINDLFQQVVTSVVEESCKVVLASTK